MSQAVFVSLETKNVKKIAEKLHRQFGHPAANKLVDLVNKAGVEVDGLTDEILRVSEACSICVRFKKPMSRPVVSMPMANSFNETLSMDLKIWDDKFFLVMIDVATRYCTAVVITNKQAKTIVSGLFLHWIVIFGAPSKIFSDNGGEFNNQEMRALGEAFNIRVITTPAESPWSNGVCERRNAVIGDSVRKIIADVNCSVEVALAWAISARNCLSNNSGFSPNQLVFGRNPGLPNVFGDKPPALNSSYPSQMVCDNLNAMHAARQEFIKFESCEKIKRALRHNVRASNSDSLTNGDRVFYKRKDDPEWHGPGTVIGRDGKLLLVRHGGVYVRVHECRIASAPHDVQVDNQATISGGSNVASEDASFNRTEDGPTDEEVSVSPEVVDPVDTEVPLQQHNDTAEASASLSEPETTEEASNGSVDVAAVRGAGRSEARVGAVPKLRNGDRIKAVLSDSGEIVSGKLLSRAGKATGLYKNCFNVKRDSDGVIQWYNFDKDFSECEIQGDEVEMLILFNSEEVESAKRKEFENWRDNDVYVESENNGEKYITVRWVITEKLKDGKPIVKARLVAKGFQENTDELRKDSPTCSKEAVRITLAIAAARGWDCNTLDVKSAYLQGNIIARDVYLKPPPEYDEGYLWKLNKTVYGLSDAARQWYLRVKEELLSLGVCMSMLDPALFSWYDGEILEGVICLYVDDFLWVGTDSFKKRIIDKLSDMFTIGSKVSRAFKYIGLNIESKNDHSTLDQIDYCQALRPVPISRRRMQEKSSELSSAEKSEFRTSIGQLNWVATQTRPDIAYDICELSVKANKGTISDLLKLNKVIGRVTNDPFKIHFPRMESFQSCSLECYSDASFANLADSGSQGGLVIFLQDSRGVKCPIYWQSRKIRRVVKSTLAAETLALVECAEAALYLKRVIRDLCRSGDLPINCYVDNKSLMDTLNSKKNVDDKRLRIDLAILDEMLQRKDINSVSWVETSLQLADCLTKRGASAERLRAAISRD